MQILLIGLFILLILDILSCYLYCKIHKERGDRGDTSVSEVSVSEENSDSRDLRLEFISSLGKILNICSILRLTLALTGYIPSHTIRNLLYKKVFFMDISEDVVIYYGAEIRAPWNIKIGKGTIIGDKAILDGRNGLTIGENVNFSTGVWVWTEQHDVNSPVFADEGAPVIIENRAWISCRCVVLPGVTIKEGSVIAAGAVVTKDTEPFSINGGIPAKKIGERNKNLEYEFHGNHLHFM